MKLPLKLPKSIQQQLPQILKNFKLFQKRFLTRVRKENLNHSLKMIITKRRVSAKAKTKLFNRRSWSQLFKKRLFLSNRNNSRVTDMDTLMVIVMIILMVIAMIIPMVIAMIILKDTLMVIVMIMLKDMDTLMVIIVMIMLTDTPMDMVIVTLMDTGTLTLMMTMIMTTVTALAILGGK